MHMHVKNVAHHNSIAKELKKNPKDNTQNFQDENSKLFNYGKNQLSKRSSERRKMTKSIVTSNNESLITQI
jgi:hypothetical protein